MTGKVLSGSDISDTVKEYEARMSKAVYIEDEHVFINVKDEYNIALSRCDTREKLLEWVYHLTEKNWMSREVLRRFMEVAAAHHGYELHLSA